DNTSKTRFRDYRGRRYAKDKQVARCGNAIPPPFAEALVRANLPGICQSEEIAA
ncbi:putative site-specific DNA methylase, partial [Salmonella enterica subsp. enterica serovar Senftenberg str. A4-543]